MAENELLARIDERVGAMKASLDESLSLIHDHETRITRAEARISMTWKFAGLIIIMVSSGLGVSQIINMFV